MSPLTEVIKKSLITSCHILNIAINSICFDTIVKNLTQYFCRDNINSKMQNQDHETKTRDAVEQPIKILLHITKKCREGHIYIAKCSFFKEIFNNL